MLKLKLEKLEPGNEGLMTVIECQGICFDMQK